MWRWKSRWVSRRVSGWSTLIIFYFPMPNIPKTPFISQSVCYTPFSSFFYVHSNYIFFPFSFYRATTHSSSRERNWLRTTPSSSFFIFSVTQSSFFHFTEQPFLHGTKLAPSSVKSFATTKVVKLESLCKLVELP